MVGVILGILGLALGALLSVVFTALKDWILSRRSIRLSLAEESSPMSVELGFAEETLKVTIRNGGGSRVEIEDIRIMFAHKFGVPLPKAPPPHSHSELPSTLDSGTAESWYFPAEKLAFLFQNIASMVSAERKVLKLRPQATTTTGKIYRGRSFRFSMDITSHWP